MSRRELKKRHGADATLEQLHGSLCTHNVGPSTGMEAGRVASTLALGTPPETRFRFLRAWYLPDSERYASKNRRAHMDRGPDLSNVSGNNVQQWISDSPDRLRQYTETRQHTARLFNR